MDSKRAQQDYDIAVFGATPAGIVCAVRSARSGARVLLVHRALHLGGFMTSGAGGWESPYDGNRSPLLTEIQQRITEHYRGTYGEGSQQHLASMPDRDSRRHLDRRKVEPRVAEQIFEQMLAEQPNLAVWRGMDVSDVERHHERIASVTFAPVGGGESRAVRAACYVDCTYEGDLTARAKVAFRVGREGRSEYDEPHAGRVFTTGGSLDPDQAGWSRDASAGRLNMRTFGAMSEQVLLPESTGEGDGCVMAYNYRLILTSDPANRLPVPKPANYNAEHVRHMAWGSIVPNLPNQKIAWNCGRLIGPQHAWPEGDWDTRERLARQYLEAILSQLWFIQNDPSADPRAKERLGEMGLPRDEFVDNRHLPYEIYVREARRIVGRYVFTEHDAVRAPGSGRTPVHADSIAITDWPLDSVACTTARGGSGKADGAFFLSESSRPAQVPYRCMLPRDCDNLLVPVALSASHVGFGAIRLEPVWMQLGEAAGYAAAMAVSAGTSPPAIHTDRLLHRLVEDGAMISFFNDCDVDTPQAWTRAIQFLGTRGFFDSYDARPLQPLDTATAEDWSARWSRLSPSAQPLAAAGTRAQAAQRIYQDLVAAPTNP